MSSLRRWLYENDRFIAIKKEEEVGCGVTMKLAGQLIKSISHLPLPILLIYINKYCTLYKYYIFYMMNCYFIIIFIL